MMMERTMRTMRTIGYICQDRGQVATARMSVIGGRLGAKTLEESRLTLGRGKREKEGKKKI